MKLTDVTVDAFCRLTAQDHATAIYAHAQRTRQLQRQLDRLRPLPASPTPDSAAADQAEELQEELRSCLQLQKVHAAALQELLAAADGATRAAA